MVPPEVPSHPETHERPALPAWRAVRASWEVAGAAVILLVVLAIIDVGAAGEPRLVLSFGPLVFLLVAALARLTPTLIVSWGAGWAVVAAVAGDARYAGLAYTAVAVALLLVLHRVRGGRR